MFTDIRSKKVVFVSHCILNQNAISDGTAVCPAAFREIVEKCLELDIGLVQMPCPELMCLGLDRGYPAGAESPVTVENTRIRREILTDPEKLDRLGSLADSVIYQMREYKKHGFEILGVIGANRSPNCGVQTTSDNDIELPGMGIFMERIAAGIKELGMDIPMTGIKTSDDLSEKLKKILR